MSKIKKASPSYINLKLLGLTVAICSSLVTAVWLMSNAVADTTSFYFVFFLGVMRVVLVLVILFITTIIGIRLLISKKRREEAL